LRQGNYAEAETALRNSGETLLKARPITEPERQEVIGHIVELYQALGKTADADGWVRRLEESSSLRKR